MYFKLQGALYVADYDLDEMADLCHRTGCSPQDALNHVSEKWDDCDFYLVGFVEDEIIAEVEKRLANIK